MKKVYLFIFLLVTGFSGFGQRATLKRANTLFANKSYVEAAVMYQQLDQTQEVLQNLGDSYYYNSQMSSAKTPYTKLYLTYTDSVPPEVLFRYANTLKALNDYEEGDKIMGKYLGYAVDTKKFKENLKKIVPYNYEIKRMTENTSTGDFGMNFYGDKVVFASFRNSENPTYHWNQRPYLDLYEARVSPDKELKDIKPFSDSINTKTHESNATFSSDGKTMYFSRTNDKRVLIDDVEIATVKLYRAELVDGSWTNVTVLPFCSDLFSTQHPMLNKDETRLYFSSDRPGTMGSFDIYYVNITGDSFGEPVNMGPTINTKHREQFPYIDSDETLYFASDGHQGLGGLDIFMSKIFDGFYSKPLNLGETINTGMDDFSYVLNEDEETGYLSSNRDVGDNLYSFTRKENPRRFIVTGDVRDKNSKNLLPGTTVTLFDEQGTVVGQMVVGEDAEYIFNTEPNTKYKIEAYRDFYIPTVEDLVTNDDGRIEFNIELEIESYDDAEEIVVTKDDGYIYIELENIYFDFNKWDIKPQAARTLDVLVNLLKKYDRMEIQLGAHTDNRASEEYNLRLSRNRAAATLEYLVENGIDRRRLRSKGYGESQPLVKCGDNCTEEEHSINRRCEFLILK
ncbi:OmpA family protein [Subsaxibacter sp. CAU 1640]|uniref:OmpA family protein n=1 Tax=Subsaxibacter sp. CAU 1640 TaxID=2933271 RepID=UPI0020045BB1|nr:OmpA family protein [Subsaxibacter sp. CAU 1640]MCK7589645.1 OmpA family protein [Subsaxibacter sp. CAU 1640]